MAWLEAHQELRDHPKTKRAARLLRIGHPQMIGHLMCLWWWCMDYADDGNLSSYDDADIAEAAGWEGDAEDFVFALLNCGPADRPGFLVATETGIFVNDWEKYAGKYIVKRNQSRERQRTYRQRNATKSDDNANVTRYNSVSRSAREEERREDKITGEKMREHERREEEDASTTTENDIMVKQWEAVLGATLTPAIFPEVKQYMDKLQARGVVDWWMLALTETTGAKRPGWQYMKAVLESWLAAGKPSTSKNGSDPAKSKKMVKIENPFTGELTEVLT